MMEIRNPRFFRFHAASNTTLPPIPRFPLEPGGSPVSEANGEGGVPPSGATRHLPPKRSGKDGTKVSPRRYNRRMIFAVSLLLGALTAAPAVKTQSLFNGRDLKGWHMDVPALDNDPNGKKPFIVRNKMLVSLGTPGGHLITDKSFHDYRLTVEYRFSAAPGNCGVLVHCSTPRALYGMFPKSIEVQMQSGDAGDFWCIGEDITVPDMEKRRGPKENWGVDGNKARRILNLTDGSEHKPGEWNTMIIECRKNTIKVWVNGDLVNDGYNCTASSGQIALQAEGSEVEFEKLELSSF